MEIQATFPLKELTRKGASRYHLLTCLIIIIIMNIIRVQALRPAPLRLKMFLVFPRPSVLKLRVS
jgi:hypothetical protein